jgi:hypothetical protein
MRYLGYRGVNSVGLYIFYFAIVLRILLILELDIAAI